MPDASVKSNAGAFRPAAGVGPFSMIKGYPFFDCKKHAMEVECF
jgi:hypothetical protein